MMWIKKIFLVLIFTAFYFSSSAYALNTDTHKAINAYVAHNSLNGFSLNLYLQDNLKFGTDTPFTSNDGLTFSAEDWIKWGGLYEDVPAWYLPYLRSVNHFYNPIAVRLGKNQGGFTGIFDTGLLSGMPAYDWATSSPNTQSPGGYYSWDDVRGYYLNALTSTTQDDRNKNFAQTFRGLGQLMHLVEDMSVPEHTRNDGHYVLYGDYENWVIDHPNAIASAAPVFFCPPLNSIKSLFDIGKYDGTNPGDTAYLSNNSTCSNIGLSEFTNANFLTDDTIFSGFTYPRIQDTELWTDPSYNRDYLRKLSVSPTDGTITGVNVDHLAASSLLYSYRWRYYPQDDKYLPLGLDSKVYADYSALLLPRAVGYSADLLKYFFRGQINMVNSSGQYYIENHSSENMTGTFSLYYDDTKGNRNKITSWSNLPVEAKKGDTPGKSGPVTFIEPTDAKERGKYIIVFKGTLGDEEYDAVVGKAVSLNPPSYVFIKQESTVLNSNPPDVFYQYNMDVRMASPKIDSKYKVWYANTQYMAGSFVTYGAIKKISVQGFQGIIKFYVGDKLVSGNVWNKDNNTDAPSTWKIEGSPWIDASSVKLVVTMADDKVFEQRLFAYRYAQEAASKEYGYYGSGTLYCSSPILIQKYYSMFGAGPIGAQFEVVQIGGHTLNDSHNTGGCDSREILNVATANYLNNAYFSVDRTTEERPLSTGNHFIDINTFYALSFPDYLPFVPSAQFKRIYSDQEMKTLNQLNIKPEEYTVDMK